MTEVSVSGWQRVRAGLGRAGGVLLAFVSFAAPFAVSLAANVTAGLHSGSRVLLVAGIAIPILLMLAIELWRRMPPASGWALVGRSLAMGAPVAVAAAWSWMDTTGLLLAQYPAQGPGSPSTVQWVLCFTAPLAVDGLAVLSVLSLRAESAPNEPSAEAAAPVAATPPRPESARDEPAAEWGPPSAVPTPPSPTTPAPRRSTLHAVRSPRPRVEHVAGWQEWMASVPYDEFPDMTKWLRARAKAVGVPVRSDAKNAELRRAVELAEVARAGAREVAGAAS